MFFSGDIQSGIALAVDQHKPVICFVTDDGVESRVWENCYLKDDHLQKRLSESAVLLRITSGSEEATLLSAVRPITSTPILLAIRNGEVYAELKPGIGRDEFTRIILEALATSDDPTTTSSPSTPSSSDSSANPSTTAITPTEEAAGANAEQLQDLYRERRERLEADRKRKADAKRAQRKLEREAEAKLATEAGSGIPQSSQAKYAQQARERKEEARRERERILKIIAGDKLDRRDRAEQRKAQTQMLADGSETSALEAPPSIENPDSRTTCFLQVRLFDGRTIRTKFASQHTLSGARKWIDQEIPGKGTRYTFKHVIAPGKNRGIEASEEEESLAGLGLTPSATLILVGAREAANTPATSRGFLFMLWCFFHDLIAYSMGLMAPLSGYFGGRHAADDERKTVPSKQTPSPMDLRKLREQRDPDASHQLYNGNQLNFEPALDEESKKDL